MSDHNALVDTPELRLHSATMVRAPRGGCGTRRDPQRVTKRASDAKRTKKSTERASIKRTHPSNHGSHGRDDIEVSPLERVLNSFPSPEEHPREDIQAKNPLDDTMTRDALHGNHEISSTLQAIQQNLQAIQQDLQALRKEFRKLRTEATIQHEIQDKMQKLDPAAMRKFTTTSFYGKQGFAVMVVDQALHAIRNDFVNAVSNGITEHLGDS